ncbi:MAG: hypothetical protein JO353_12675, partial [Phycisphaerae bacterium]|nr:hypothetical protein [Phycisphaerae bacterium]
MKFARGPCFFLSLLLACSARAIAQDSIQTHYIMPDALADGENRLAAITTELDNPTAAPSVSDAAKRFETLMHDSENGLLATSDGSEVSLRFWINDLPASRRKALLNAMDQLTDSTARQAMEDVKSSPFPDPIAYYAVARRYPMNAVAGDALKAAAAQSAAIGDNVTNAAFTAMAEGK